MLKQRIFNLNGPDELSDTELAEIVKEHLPNASIEVEGGGVGRRPLTRLLLRDSWARVEYETGHRRLHQHLHKVQRVTE